MLGSIIILRSSLIAALCTQTLCPHPQGVPKRDHCAGDPPCHLEKMRWTEFGHRFASVVWRWC